VSYEKGGGGNRAGKERASDLIWGTRKYEKRAKESYCHREEKKTRGWIIRVSHDHGSRAWGGEKAPFSHSENVQATQEENKNNGGLKQRELLVKKSRGLTSKGVICQKGAPTRKEGRTARRGERVGFSEVTVF